MFNQQLIATSVNEVDSIINLLNLTPGDNILDLGCGIGRISLEFARRGFQVTGVDRTSNYLDEAKEQAEKENLDIEFILEDMRTFSRSDSFNTVLSLFTSFGYFENPEDDRQVIRNIYNSLKTGGTLLIDTHGKETLTRIFRERDWNEADGVIVLQERKVSRNWSWMQARWIMLKGDERLENEISHRIYAATEMEALLTRCGFSRVEIYGNYDGEPYDHKARRLMAIGYK